ncbi:MAG: hypothetical protein HY880_08250, partial [Deltaproteobacteria bacterium]|nr:hypothetical protein [Deltaproteobacteria bacterium]
MSSACKKINISSVLLLALLSVILFPSDKIFALAAPSGAAPAVDFSKRDTLQKAQKLRMPFIKNEGQEDENISFYSKTFGGTVYVKKNGDIIYSLPEVRAKGAAKKAVISERISGGKVNEIKGEGKAITRVNYFRGSDKSKWQANVPTYDFVDM